MDTLNYCVLLYISLFSEIFYGVVTEKHVTVTKSMCDQSYDITAVGELYLHYEGADLNTYGGIPYLNTCKITIRNPLLRDMTCIMGFTELCQNTFKYYYSGTFYLGPYVTCSELFYNPRCDMESEVYAAFESRNFTGAPPSITVKIFINSGPIRGTTTRRFPLSTTKRPTQEKPQEKTGSWNGYYNIPIILGSIVVVIVLLTCCLHKARFKRSRDRSAASMVMNARPMDVASVQGHAVSIQTNPFQNNVSRYSSNLHPHPVPTAPFLETSAGQINTGNDHTGSSYPDSNDVKNGMSPSPWDPPTYESLFGYNQNDTYYNNLSTR